ncbi:MAG: ABC transporter substrate-binding protein, partial [Actinomycetota bacterium]|nr:ABC transporter substrate-binding protein [Actinomycetota bacterium]
MRFVNRQGATRRLVAIALAGAVVLAACSDSEGSSDDSSGGGDSETALLIARGMDINSLDPSRAYCDTCQIYMTAVYETLIGLDKDNKTLVPRLATEWTGNAEQTEFTFTLDPDAKFADGSPVTSADVKFSW